MKMRKILLCVFILSCICVGCGGDKEETVEEAVIEKEHDESVQKESVPTEEMKIYSLSSETDDVSIEIGIPGVFQQTEYCSDNWLALEIPGDDEESSTQLMMYLEADESVDVKEAMLEEVNYLMSANTDDWEKVDRVEEISADYHEWAYVTYELDGLEGYKLWCDLENGTTLVGTIENIGNNPEPVDIHELVSQIDATIRVD